MSPISTNPTKRVVSLCEDCNTRACRVKKSKTIAIMFRNTIVVPTSVRPGSSSSEDRIRQPLTTFSPTSMKPSRVGKNKPTFFNIYHLIADITFPHTWMVSIGNFKKPPHNNHSLTTGCPSFHPILPSINNNYENPTLHLTSPHHQPDYLTNHHHPIIVLHFLEHLIQYLVWNNREIVLPLKCHTNHHH